MIIAQVSYILMGAVDNIMIAKVGVDELATAAFCNNLFAIVIVTQMGLASAVSPLIANAIGAKDLLRVGKLYRHALVLLLLFSIVMMGIMFVMGLNMHHFGQAPAVNESFWTYYPYLMLNLPFIAIHQAHKQFYDGIENSRSPMLYLYLAIPLNVFLNWVFIYGNLGMPNMGLSGAGLATILSRVLTLGLFVYNTHTNSLYKEQYKLSFRKFKLEKNIWKLILVLGIPSSFQYLFEVGAFATAGISAGQLGKIEIASHQIALNLASFPFMAALGWSFASSIKIGAALGEKDILKCRRIGFNSLSIVVVYMMITASILILARNYLPLIYLDDKQIVGLVASLMVITGAFQLADGIQAVAIGMLRGLQDMKIPTVITFFAYWAFAIPFGRYLAFNTELKLFGIWYGLAGGLYISAAFLLWRFHIVTKNKEAHLN